MKTPWIAVILVAGLEVSCSSSQSPAPAVPVEGAKKSDLSLLVGKWTGDYVSPDTGRSGSIVFELKSKGAEAAHGDVLMWPKGSQKPDSSKMPQVLNIEFVKSEGGYVTGTMDTYKDPDCQCDVRTTFVGSIDGDIIVGEFTTERFDQQGKPAKGTWKVRRDKT